MGLTGNIDIVEEELLTIRETCERTRVSADSIRRWMLTPFKDGTQLDAVRIGNRLMTSVEALRRFTARRSGIEVGPAGNQNHRPRTSFRRRGTKADAERRCREYGI